MSFFGSLFGGQDETLDKNIPALGTQGDFSADVGNKNVTAASSYYDGLLSGDPTKQAEALAPQIGAEKGQAEQQKKTLAEFGNRGGGTGAAAATIDDKTRADITGLTGTLTSNAAGAAANLGTQEQGIGLEAKQMQDQAAQQQLQNWLNSIFGQATSSGVGSAEGAALKYLHI